MIKGKKILCILPRFFYPPNDGGKIVFSNTIKEFSKHNTVDVISNISSQDKRYVPYVQKMVRKLVVIPFDATKQHFLTLLHAFFSRQSYFYLKYYRKAIIKRIDQYLKEESYDLIWLESGYMSYYGKYIKEHYPNIKLVYRSHNVEYLVLKNTASETKNFFKKYLIEREQRFLEKQEIDMLSYADKIFTITPEDRDIFIAKKPDLKDKIFVLSPSIDFEKYERTPITQEKNLVFIGTLSYLPNVYGIEWFIKNVFPTVEKDFPDVKLYVLGKGLPRGLGKLSKNNIIFDAGLKEDMHYYHLARIFICPLFSGGGIKIKVLNGFASGNVVLTTSVGVEGMSVTPESEVLLGNSKEEWIELIRKYFNDDASLAQISQKGYEYARENFDADKVYDKIVLE